MSACWCTLGNTGACKHCPNNTQLDDVAMFQDVDNYLDYYTYIAKQWESIKTGMQYKQDKAV